MTYLQQRIQALQLAPEDYTVKGNISPDESAVGKKTYPLLTENKDNDIVINYCEIDGDRAYYYRNHKAKPYERIRYHPDKLVDDERKYKTPFGGNSRLFFPPLIVKHYCERSETPALIVTEGEFKALKLCALNLPSIAAQGIHNLLQQKELFPEMSEFIKRCKVKRVIFLMDADCLTVKWKQDKDLFQRPNSFFAAVRNFREACKEAKIDTYFAHIHTKYEQEAKGIDDLLAIHLPEKVAQELRELKTGKFIFAVNLEDKPTVYLKDYFHITDHKTFYSAYKDEIDDNEFVYCGNAYKPTRDENDELKLIRTRIGEAEQYVRVGINYFKKTIIKDEKGKREELKRTDRTCIKEDHKEIKDILYYVKKYDGFCVEPEHIHYRREVNNLYNKYSPLIHEPLAGNISASLAFVRHIFGEQIEHGLDYLQLLYLKPKQPQYVICLVSKEQETGKTTFLRWLAEIFGNNICQVTSSDLDGSFNADWVKALALTIDEARISEKAETKDRLKNLVTANKLRSNEKGVQQEYVDTFLKVVLCTNNEDNFMNIEQQDKRFWIRKVHAPVQRSVDLLADLIEEIPAFLHFLQNRKMQTPKPLNRFWLPEDVILTKERELALRQSEPVILKELRYFLTEVFTNATLKNLGGQSDIYLTISQIKDIVKRQYKGSETYASSSFAKALKECWNCESKLMKRKILDLEMIHASVLNSSHNPDQTCVSIGIEAGRLYHFERDKFVDEVLLNDAQKLKAEAPIQTETIDNDVPF